MDLVDVHAHLDHEEFANNLASVLSRAKAKGVVTVIAQGINHETNQKVIALAKEHPIVKIALGLYPSEADSVLLKDGFSRQSAYTVETTLEFIEKHSKNIIALGEVGMDFHESEDKKNQEKLFRRIVQLAKKLHKPLIIHSRKAEKEVLDILEDEQYKRAVMHCFMGSKKLLERGVKMGLYFSIPSAVVRIQQFQENVAAIPITQLLTETDAPYLAPMKDLRSEPCNVRDGIEKIAEIKRMDVKEVANQLYFNYQKLFQ